MIEVEINKERQKYGYLSPLIFDNPTITNSIQKKYTYMNVTRLFYFDVNGDNKYIDVGSIYKEVKDNNIIGESSASTSRPSTSSHGGKKVSYKRTDKKISYKGRERTVYVGLHNKQFIQLNRQMVAVSSLK
jgi:hypothetical protein